MVHWVMSPSRFATTADVPQTTRRKIRASHVFGRIVVRGGRSGRAMPRPSEFSEFSYGYATIEALVQKWRPSLAVAPSFLSLTEEGEPAKGYDASLQPRGVPIFLQFKLSELLVGGSTRETRGGVPILLCHRLLGSAIGPLGPAGVRVWTGRPPPERVHVDYPPGSAALDAAVFIYLTEEHPQFLRKRE